MALEDLNRKSKGKGKKRRGDHLSFLLRWEMKINPSIAITGKTIEGNSGISVSAFLLSVSVLNLGSILLNVPTVLTRAGLLAVTVDVASFDLTCLLLYVPIA
jgi:hypothetical protein